MAVESRERQVRVPTWRPSLTSLSPDKAVSVMRKQACSTTSCPTLTLGGRAVSSSTLARRLFRVFSTAAGPRRLLRRLGISGTCKALSRETHLVLSTFCKQAESMPLMTLGSVARGPLRMWKPRSQSDLRTGRVGLTRSTSALSSLSSSGGAKRVSQELRINGSK